MITGIVPGTAVAHGMAATVTRTVAMVTRPMAVMVIRTAAMVTRPMVVTATHTGVMLILTVAMLIPMEQQKQHQRKNRQSLDSPHTDQAAVLRTGRCQLQRAITARCFLRFYWVQVRVVTKGREGAVRWWQHVYDFVLPEQFG